MLLVITNDFGPRTGGIESFVHAMLERLPHGSFLVYTSHQQGAAAFDADFTARTGARVVRDKSRVLLPTPRAISRAVALARESGASSVWFGAAAPLGLMARALRRRAGVRMIVATTHGHEVWWAKVPVTRQAMRRIGHGVDVLTYLGEFTRTAIAPALRPSDRAKLQRLAPGVDLKHFVERDADLIRQRHGLGDAPVIVCISRLVHRKGQDRLIEAMPLILKSLPSARLLLVGKGPRRDYLEKRAAKIGVSDAVIFAGAVPYAELPGYYSAGSIFAMPTRSRLAGMEVEGLGMVYLEASACRRAVIAGRSGGSPDALVPDRTGVLVDDRVSDIAEAAIGLLSDPDLCAAMGVAGRDWVEREWNWDFIQARFADWVLD